MKITILYFGRARELAAVHREHLDLPVSNVGELRTWLASNRAGIDIRLGYAVAINESYAADSSAFEEGDVVAILPPVSGG